MATFSIVEHLDVFEQISMCLIPGSVANAVHTFAFEYPEAVFDERIVVAIRGRAHAAFYAVALTVGAVYRLAGRGHFGLRMRLDLISDHVDDDHLGSQILGA
jgi:hypothetical protein